MRKLPFSEVRMEMREGFFIRRHFLTLICVNIIIFLFLDFMTGQFFLPRIKGVRSPYYNHDLKVNFHTKGLFGPLEYDVFTNSLGFRDARKRKVRLNTDKWRILFIGDSFTYGSGVPYEKSFVGRFSALLPSDKFKVLNAGVVSYSPKLYYLKLKYLLEIKKLRFHELFVFIDISDIQDELRYEGYRPAAISLREKTNIFIARNFYLLGRIKQGLRLGSRLKEIIMKYAPVADDTSLPSYLAEALSDRMLTDPDVFELYGKKGLSLAMTNMHLLYDLCQRHHIRMHIVVYPWPYQVRKRELHSRNVGAWREFCRVHGGGFLDCFPLFIGSRNPEDVIKEYYIKGDAHWNENGHSLVANCLFQYWRTFPKVNGVTE